MHTDVGCYNVSCDHTGSENSFANQHWLKQFVWFKTLEDTSNKSKSISVHKGHSPCTDTVANMINKCSLWPFDKLSEQNKPSSTFHSMSTSKANTSAWPTALCDMHACSLRSVLCFFFLEEMNFEVIELFFCSSGWLRLLKLSGFFYTFVQLWLWTLHLPARYFQCNL